MIHIAVVLFSGRVVRSPTQGLHTSPVSHPSRGLTVKMAE